MVVRTFLAASIIGLIIVVGEAVLNGVVLADEWTEMNTSLGIGPPTVTTSAAALLKLYALGFVVLWLYWTMRPRFGAGRKTALIAGGFVAFMIWVWALLGLWLGGYVNLAIAGPTLIWGLIEVPLAALAGVTVWDNGTQREN